MPDALTRLDEGRRAERLGMLERALEAYEAAEAATTDESLRVEALTRQADVLRARCEWDSALERARQSASLAEQAGLTPLMHEARNAEALVHLSRGNLDEAGALLGALAPETSDPRLKGIILSNLGIIHAQQGRLGAAERAFAESSGCFQRAGYERGEAIALNNQGRVMLDRGDGGAAVGVLERVIRLARIVEDAELISLGELNLAEALMPSDLRRADELVCTALGHFQSSGNRWRQVECLRLMGLINQSTGAAADAVRCFERALGLARSIDARGEIAALEDMLRRAAGGAGS